MSGTNTIGMRHRTGLASLVLAAALAVGSAANADVIDFAGLDGTVANPLSSPGASFTTLGGFNVISNEGLCASPDAGSPANCAQVLEVSFDAGSSGVSFTFWANNNKTVGADIGDVSIFSGATLLGLVDLIVLDTSSASTSRDLVALTGYTGVTRLQISSTDFGGVLYDDFTFTPQAAVPEPMTWAMMLMGFAGLGAALRRRRAIAA